MSKDYEEYEAEALERAAERAEHNRDFDVAARLYREAAEKWQYSGWGIKAERCYDIAEIIDD
jgi:hypothetical protein